MKKAILITVSIMLAATLAACSDGGKKVENSPNTTNTQGTQPTQSGQAAQKNPIVTITMDDGSTIKLELYPDKAPNTVNNFIALANTGFYDGLTFHRIIDGFMIQGGDPDGKGYGGPGYFIKGEFAKNGFKQNDIKHVPGVISMARGGDPAYNSAGSQFFIMVGSAPSLDGSYAAFGKVMDDDSMKAVQAIAKTPVGGPENSTPKSPVKIKKIVVDTFGVNYPDPEKIKK